ncbi:type II toxin-antitoxin system HicA family toxin [Labrys wisconsinensis]|uniref:HicA protein n=1 Tax=Labrys wisconsinensis TaxID=425677 RepID=A0ABU0JHJ3_9HYPH|nr:type II toxin-antitoxin system HicA family toxin [Labrys wisconsinensis]MDQ0473757.1 hypothetical protein [Labrys wisconsinensis]
MNGRQRRTLKTVLADPVSGTIDWCDIESLLIAAGCEMVEGTSSRIRLKFGDEIVTFHRPCPEEEARRYQVREAREFLGSLGVAR